jgi:exosome complex protein LRP1
VDKDAATRFIQAAIRQAVTPQQVAQPSATTSAEPSSSTQVPVKVTDKMRARAEYEKKIAEEDEEEEDTNLEVFDESADAKEQPTSKSKGKQKALEPVLNGSAVVKRRKRTAMDVIDSEFRSHA